MVYHVLNRGNGRMRIFHKDGDYQAFQRVLTEGMERYAVELFSFCLMPNHWHLVVRPGTDEALGRWLGWVGVMHVRRYHEHYHSRGGGHLYQGRFKSFPVAEDDYFLALCRYVEANALRAGLVERTELWPWSGLWQRTREAADLPLAAWPVEQPRLVGAGQSQLERGAIEWNPNLYPTRPTAGAGELGPADGNPSGTGIRPSQRGPTTQTENQ